MSELILNEGNFNDVVMNSDGLVLVDFFATWCGPCKMLSPVISEIANDFSDSVKVCKVNVDENQALTQKFNISSVPTLIFFKNGNAIKSSVGFHSKSELDAMIKDLL